MSAYYKETEYGFEWGAAKIERLFSDPKRKTVTIGVRTPKMDVEIYVTKTGKVRVADKKGEWKP